MNTTPTITNPDKPSYTVVGGQRSDRIRKYSSLVTILLLNRYGTIYTDDFLKKFYNLDFAEILCIEGPQISYNIDSRARRFPHVRFLLLEKDTTIGEKINIGIDEARSVYVFVIWSDMEIVGSTFSEKMFATIKEDDSLCTVPLLKTEKAEIVPFVFIPAFIKRKLNILSINKAKNGTTTILPADYCGIYSREKFILHQGFDTSITNPYWQKLDFGFRAFMWGEKITCYPTLAVRYTSHTSHEDNTVDKSYKAFYLKNMAVRCKKKKGYLPNFGYFGYMLRSDTGPIASLKEFFTTKKWVKENAHRFKKDAKRVITEWRIPE